MAMISNTYLIDNDEWLIRTRKSYYPDKLPLKEYKFNSGLTIYSMVESDQYNNNNKKIIII